MWANVEEMWRDECGTRVASGGLLVFHNKGLGIKCTLLSTKDFSPVSTSFFPFSSSTFCALFFSLPCISHLLLILSSVSSFFHSSFSPFYFPPTSLLFLLPSPSPQCCTLITLSYTHPWYTNGAPDLTIAVSLTVLKAHDYFRIEGTDK